MRVEASQYVYPPFWGKALGSAGNGQHFKFSTGMARFYFSSGDNAFTLLNLSGPVRRVTLSALPAGSGTVSGAGLYPGGLSASAVATPNAGFVFVNWTENGTAVSTLATYNFTPATNRALVANFAPAHTITTGAAPVTGGTTSGDGSYAYGASVTVSATASASYAFVNWTEGGTPVSVAAHYTFTAGADRILTANFVPTAVNLATVFDHPHNGSGNVIKSAWYYPGDQGLDGDQYTYDDFTLTNSQTITEVRWRGGYTNFKSGAGESPVADFTVSIYPSIAAGSEPDRIAGPMVRYAVGGNAGETSIGTFSGTPLYDYRFTLPTAFNEIGRAHV